MCAMHFEKRTTKTEQTTVKLKERKLSIVPKCRHAFFHKSLINLLILLPLLLDVTEETR